MAREVRTMARLRNYGDEVLAERGLMEPGMIRVVDVSGAIVDTGATRLVLTDDLVGRLGLTTAGEIGVKYADNRVGRKPIARGVTVEIMGRSGTFDAIVESDGQPLIGMGVLAAWTFGRTSSAGS